ncbi:hypothetical protein BH20ACT11_BH20ACT11_04630 [soil metagenome]
MRVAWVAFACRVLATFPDYLPLAWRAAKPVVATRYAERAADDARIDEVHRWIQPVSATW